MTKSDDENGRGGLIPTIMRSVMSWIDRPWKVLAFLVIGCAVLMGSIVWENRVHIVTVMVRDDHGTQIRDTLIPNILSDLMRSTDAEFTAVYRLDVERNRKRLLYAMGRQGRRIAIDQVTQPLVRSLQGRGAMILPSLLLDQNPCLQAAGDTETEIHSFTTRDNIHYYCVTGVKTAFGALRGMIIIGFVGPITDEPNVTAMLRIAAQQIIEGSL